MVKYSFEVGQVVHGWEIVDIKAGTYFTVKCTRCGNVSTCTRQSVINHIASFRRGKITGEGCTHCQPGRRRMH